MAILDLSEIKTAEELEARAQRDLEGKTLSQIAEWIRESDDTARVSSKSHVGDLIERGYFGLKRNSSRLPDITHLNVEVKTSPLKIGKRDGRLRVKEPLSLNIINYGDEAKTNNIKESSFYKKNQKVLFVWYVHMKGVARSEYVIKYVFLWEINQGILDELSPDYDSIVKRIRDGEAHCIRQKNNNLLTLCPKHNGKFKDPNERTSKTTQPFSDAPAEVRAFRLKSAYMNTLIRRYLSRERPEELGKFVLRKYPIAGEMIVS